jgi:hypothetical protein
VSTDITPEQVRKGWPVDLPPKQSIYG